MKVRTGDIWRWFRECAYVGYDLGVGSGDGLRLAVVVLLDDRLNMFVCARYADQLVALLVHQQLALDALEALPAKAPDAVMAECTESSLNDKSNQFCFHAA